MPFPALHGIEHVVDGVEQLLIQRLNSELVLVWEQHKEVPGLGQINLQRVEPNAYYKADVVEPKALPAVFIIGDRTDHRLHAQNFDLQDHVLLVGLLCEDKEYNQLTRKVWRYAEALYRVLHDAAAGHSRLLVEETSYSPTYGSTGDRDVRHFRKDVTLRVRARHVDPFA